jgi:hypothetical protein
VRSWLTLDDCHSPRVMARYWPKCGSWMKRDGDDASLFGAGATRASGWKHKPSRPDSLPKPACHSVALLTTTGFKVDSPNHVRCS